MSIFIEIFPTKNLAFIDLKHRIYTASKSSFSKISAADFKLLWIFSITYTAYVTGYLYYYTREPYGSDTIQQ